MFHIADGLYFEALPYGDIQITKKNTQGDLEFQLSISRSQFASVVAACCERGYCTETFYDAYALLQAPKDTVKP